MLINLEHVSRLDTAGLAELVACQLRALNRQGIVKLLNAPPRAWHLLRMSSGVEVFDTFIDETRALCSF